MNPKGLAFGFNYYGQLGLEDYTKKYIPTKLNDIKAKYVSCGQNILY